MKTRYLNRLLPLPFYAQGTTDHDPWSKTTLPMVVSPIVIAWSWSWWGVFEYPYTHFLSSDWIFNVSSTSVQSQHITTSSTHFLPPKVPRWERKLGQAYVMVPKSPGALAKQVLGWLPPLNPAGLGWAGRCIPSKCQWVLMLLAQSGDTPSPGLSNHY